MENKKNNWLNSPSKSQLIGISIVWVISLSLLILAITDLFQSKPNGNTVIDFIVIGSTTVMIRIYFNYFRFKKIKLPSK